MSWEYAITGTISLIVGIFGSTGFWTYINARREKNSEVYKKIDDIEIKVDGYIEKMLSYGYLKKDGDAILPNVVVFDRGAESADNAELDAKLSSLKEEIVGLFRQAPSMTRGYVVEQAVKNGWLCFSDDLIPTAGAFIYL